LFSEPAALPAFLLWKQFGCFIFTLEFFSVWFWGLFLVPRLLRKGKERTAAGGDSIGFQ
jgi:hypothetical protein